MDKPVYCYLCGRQFDDVRFGYAHLQAMRRAKDKRHDLAIENPRAKFIVPDELAIRALAGGGK